jgi:CRISPR-associated endonuclease Csn1
MVTATLRKSWGLEAILREAAPAANAQQHGKPRTDQRHHAVDAITIALSSQAMVQRMSIAAASAPGWQQDRRVFRGMEAPWPNFVDSIRPAIERMIVSHRPEHKMSRALHKESLYGRPYTLSGLSYVNLRRRLEELTSSQIKDIVDPAVRLAVEDKLAEHGGDCKKFNPEIASTLPSLASKRGAPILIRRVRVRERKNSDALLALRGNRFVQSDEIHHIELFVQRNGRQDLWVHVPVTLMDAYSRRRRNLPVVARTLDEDYETEFLFSLMKGDLVEMELQGHRGVYRVKKFYSSGQIWFAHCNNAQPDKDQQRDGTRWSKRPDSLRQLNPRKVTVDLLGRIHPAND